MFLVDTNILVYAANADSPDHRAARRALDGWRRAAERWFLTWPVAYEFLRVVTHRRVMAKPLTLGEAWRFLQVLLASPSCGVLVETERHAEVLARLAAEHSEAGGNLLHDLHTVALMREHGVEEIRTADTDFHRFAGIRVVNPVRHS